MRKIGDASMGMVVISQSDSSHALFVLRKVAAAVTKAVMFLRSSTSCNVFFYFFDQYAPLPFSVYS